MQEGFPLLVAACEWRRVAAPKMAVPPQDGSKNDKLNSDGGAKRPMVLAVDSGDWKGAFQSSCPML